MNNPNDIQQQLNKTEQNKYKQNSIKNTQCSSVKQQEYPKLGLQHIQKTQQPVKVDYSQHYWEQTQQYPQINQQNYVNAHPNYGWSNQCLQGGWQQNQGFYQQAIPYYQQNAQQNYHYPPYAYGMPCNFNQGFSHHPNQGFVHPNQGFRYQSFPIPFQSCPFQDPISNQPKFKSQGYKICHDKGNKGNRGSWGEGRGKFRGRGRCFKNQNSPHKYKNYKQKWSNENKNQCQNADTKYDQSQDQSSSSGEECQKLQKQLKNMSLKNKKQQVINSFVECLNPFFVQYKVTQGAKHRIINYLIKRFNKVQDLDQLITVLYSLQSNYPQYLNSPYFGFFVIIKQSIKKQYNLSQIINIMQKKTRLKQKKLFGDLNFQMKYPQPVQIQFLELSDLMQLDYTKTLFLVDGNNIMSKQKIFRNYFQSKQIKRKAQGQIRLRWLFAQSLQSQLFFDNKYDNALYQQIKQQILSQKQLIKVNNSIVYYADKQNPELDTADKRIIHRLQQIIQNEEYKNFDIVLVSADKQIAQICIGLAPIKKTSGIHIFKYCKYVIKDKNYNNPQMKGIIKKIFTY